jgi:hypothetical protein
VIEIAAVALLLASTLAIVIWAMAGLLALDARARRRKSAT